MRKSIALAVFAGTASLFVPTAAHAIVANWTDDVPNVNGNWSDTTRWHEGLIPNAQGDTAQYLGGIGSQVTFVDVVGGVRVGTLRAAMTTNISWQIRPVNDVIMDHDGAGPGRASILNEIQSTTGTNNPAIFVNSNTGWLTLNDDLFISNTSNSARTGGAVQMQTKIQGNGNIWIENISNNIGAGQVAFTGQGAYGGHTTIAKGAVTFTRGDIFAPSPPNVVTIGSTGGGDATLAAVGGGLGNMENNFAAAANSGGTLVFAANSSTSANINIKSSSSQTLPHSLVTLNGDLSFDNRATNGSVFVIGDPIVGVGKLTKIGPGPVRVTNTNTYAGGTVVNAGSLAVGFADAINNGFGFYDATVGTLGSGDVTVNSAFGTNLQIETGASTNAIADTATLRLAGCDSAFGCTGGIFGTADGGFLQLDTGINEVVSALLLSSDGGANYVAQAPGTYGATGSGATNMLDEYFSGTGILTVTPAGLPGDFNSDGKVDAGDYATWRKNEVANATLPNDNGAGNQADRFTLWCANFGNPPGSGAGLNGAQVPEPGTLLLAVAGVLFACVRPTRR